MKPGERDISFGGMIIAILVLINTIVLSNAITIGPHWYGWLFATLPALVLALIPISRHQDKRDPEQNHSSNQLN